MEKQQQKSKTSKKNYIKELSIFKSYQASNSPIFDSFIMNKADTAERRKNAFLL